MLSRLRTFPAAAVLATLAALAAGCTASTDGASPPAKESSPAASSTPRETAPSAPATAQMDVEMGHCYVEPVRFDGVLWNVPFDRQFGWGGLEPKHWQGAGVMTRVSADRARFEDRGGATVAFRPVDHPSVRRVEKAVCY